MAALSGGNCVFRFVGSRRRRRRGFCGYSGVDSGIHNSSQYVRSVMNGCLVGILRRRFTVRNDYGLRWKKREARISETRDSCSFALFTWTEKLLQAIMARVRSSISSILFVKINVSILIDFLIKANTIISLILNIYYLQ